MSNTRHLIENQGYSAVLIEGSSARFQDLQKNYAQNRRVTPLNRFVGFTPADGLDHILAATAIPRNFDFLSIDIDGNDYHTWNAFSQYQPKVVCIEFNPTIPTEIIFIQPADPAVSQGTSLRAIVELGKAKGYELVSVLDYNAFFVRAEYFPLFEIADNRPETLRTSLNAITYLFSGYDGRIFLQGGLMMPWHKIQLRESKVQQLPWFLREYPENYNDLQRFLLRAYACLLDPQIVIRKLRRLLRRPDAPPTSQTNTPKTLRPPATRPPSGKP